MSFISLEEEETQVFYLVGAAITRWSYFEARLSSIFAMCMGPSYGTSPHGIQMFDPSPSQAVFYSVDNFRSKLAMVDAALRTRFQHMAETDEILAAWTRLHTKARKLSLKRNRLAHWNVIKFDKEKPGRRVRLVPGLNSPSYQDYAFGTKVAPSKRDLELLTKAFSLLETKGGELMRLMVAHPGLSSRFAELISHQMSSAEHQKDLTVLERLKRALSWPE